MATFVRRPPLGLRVVSFFITARLAAQDDRQAFVQVVSEQLAELLGQDLPRLDDASRDARLLDLLEQGARACAAAGERLVLIVDGLDEDRGVTAGHGAHSIAALLPAVPPSDMRIVVSGRPNPPVPEDVPPWHPLRDHGIVRRLAASAHARDMRHLAGHELKRLLAGSVAEQDLLGLLTAARGGLSGADLTELTGQPPWVIEQTLHGVSGRTFERRISQWREEAHEVYLLGHEELQAAAGRYLGEERLADYRARLHGWAMRYRELGWPERTPEYLLRGYFRMLTTTKDRSHIIECASDQARHDRLLELTGGDAAGLSETMTALTMIAAEEDPDLAVSLSLARHRDRLIGRNARIPPQLPGVWAAIGQFHHAESLAQSMKNPDWKAAALAEVACKLAESGHTDRALEAAVRAQVAADLIGKGEQRALAMADVAVAMAASGQTSRAAELTSQAEAAARSFTDPYEMERAQVKIAKALASTGQAGRAETIAGAIADSCLRAQAMAEAASALAGTGHTALAVAMAIRAREGARSAGDLSLSAQTLAEAASALARAGQPEEARQAAADAEAIARSIKNPAQLASAMAAAASALARAGQPEEARQAAADAEAIARSIKNPAQLASAMAAAASALARAGQPEEARQAAADAEAIARSIKNPAQLASAMAAAASALAHSGHFEQAEALASSISQSDAKAQAIRAVADALARAGKAGDALAASARALQETRAYRKPGLLRRSITYSAEWLIADLHRSEVEVLPQATRLTEPRGVLALPLAEGAFVLATAGLADRATEVAAMAVHPARLSGLDPGLRSRVLATASAALARSDQIQLAAGLATRAETTARSMNDGDQ